MQIMEQSTPKDLVTDPNVNDIGNTVTSLMESGEKFSILIRVNEGVFLEGKKSEIIFMIQRYGTIIHNLAENPYISMVPFNPKMAHQLEQDYHNAKLPGVDVMEILTGYTEALGNSRPYRE